MQNKEIEKILSCDNCPTSYACEGCEITWTDKKKIKEYIDQLENKVKELEVTKAMKEYRINEMDIPKQAIIDKIEELKNHLKIAEENICDFNVTNYWHRQKLKFTHQIWALQELQAINEKCKELGWLQ